LFHITQGSVIWVGQDINISADDGSTFPIEYGSKWDFTVPSGNDNELYAVASTGTVKLYTTTGVNI